MSIVPQMAIWLENSIGKKVSDIYVSEYFYIQAKNDMVKQPENLPVWLFRTGYDPHMQDGTLLPDPPVPKTDATCGATPKKKFSKDFTISEKGDRFTLYFEINNSFDFNDTFKRVVDRQSNAYNVANGQPSLIYKVDFNPRTINKEELILFGYGSALGISGKIYKDLSVITDAKNIVKTVYIEKVR